MKTRKTVPPFKNWQKVAPQIVCATSASWAMLCTGLVRGWSSSAIPQLTAEKNDTLHLEQEEAAWITSLPPLCGIFGSLMIAFPMEFFGRRMTLATISIPYVLGFYLMGLSYYVNWTPLLFIGRVITGLLTGASAPTSQIYVSECASPRIRGALGSFTATFLSLGILIAYIIGAVVEWQILCFIIGSMPIVLGLAMMFMPETPSWLVAHDQESQAKVALQQLRGKYTDIEPEFERIKFNDNSHGSNNIRYIKILTSCHLMKPLLISMALMFFQQFSGINAIVFYSASIFQEAGSTIDRFVSSIMIGVVQLIFTVISALLVDRFGRRVLLMTSGTFMAVSLSGLGAFVYVKKAWEELSVVDESTVEEQNLLAELGWLPLLCLMSFIISYSFGFGAVPQLVMGELFPSEYRHRMGTISVSFSVLCTFVVVRTFPLMASTMGLASVYGLYATCCLTAVVFVGLFLPETKGKTLEEISSFFGQPQPNDVAAEDPCIPLEHKTELQDSSLADGFPLKPGMK
ncbi:facilitated trehalose transporter Tret1-2 homolog isoform X2 [Daphnia pulicaria]|uniref:facilitated trehalose transporter Tret1-2 homolog isoform X2 n=1 Tax=Daphnia pulicaria TaxID=35523 RepID=UPI001EEAC02E|nr:facilitated trehalose transporter Tret1-2 homolog isoform X2 [Daphnia pulicaria]XP_046649045.1 facilitated trehalose transporter Tret1-2 homolog isoform X2 [Daphnia pulicaria]